MDVGTPKAKSLRFSAGWALPVSMSSLSCVNTTFPRAFRKTCRRKQRRWRKSQVPKSAAGAGIGENFPSSRSTGTTRRISMTVSLHAAGQMVPFSSAFILQTSAFMCAKISHWIVKRASAVRAFTSLTASSRCSRRNSATAFAV